MIFKVIDNPQSLVQAIPIEDGLKVWFAKEFFCNELLIARPIYFQMVILEFDFSIETVTDKEILIRFDRKNEVKPPKENRPTGEIHNGWA